MDEQTSNTGNFRALLALRVEAGDTELKNHLLSASLRKSYISKTVQNELIEICGEQIIESITKDLQAAKFFSVIADDTTDISR